MAAVRVDVGEQNREREGKKRERICHTLKFFSQA
jgi:hypothetical protein